MKVVVIGGTGFLGHFVVNELVSRGHAVTAVGRPPAPQKGYLPDSAEIVMADINDSSDDALVRMFDSAGAGGCSGIGEATARLAAARGAKVMIASLHPEKLSVVANEITNAGGICKWITCDIRDENQVKAMVSATVSEFGRLDAAYNNAGVSHGPVLTHEVSQELWDRVLAVNVTGTYYCCREELRTFLAQGGGGVNHCCG